MRSTARRALLAAGWVTLGVMVGIVASAWILPKGDDAAVSQETPAVPEDCLHAIRAARERLLLNAETSQVVTSYPELVRRAADAVAALDAVELRALLDEARELNERGRRVIERARGTDFSTPARSCEERAEETSAQA